MLGVSTERAEGIASDMIGDGRLQASIDQVWIDITLLVKLEGEDLEPHSVVKHLTI